MIHCVNTENQSLDFNGRFCSAYSGSCYHIGVVREWWMHAPSSYWFIAERHNQSDEVVRTYDPSELFGEGELSLPATEQQPDSPGVS